MKPMAQINLSLPMDRKKEKKKRKEGMKVGKEENLLTLCICIYDGVKGCVDYIL